MVCSDYQVYRNYFYLTASILSLAGSLIVILFIWFKKLYHSYSFKILFMISINDLIRACLGIFLAFFGDSELFCIISAYVFSCISSSNNLWALCITFTIYQIVVKEESNFTKYEKIWIILTYPISLIVEALPLITSSYGSDESFCGFKSNFIGEVWRFAVLYLPVVLGVGASIVLSIKIHKKLSEISESFMSSLVFDRGLIYAIILAAVEIPLLIIRAIQMFHKSCLLFHVVLVFFFIFQLQGFFNALVFLGNKTIRKVVLKKESHLVINSMGIDSLNVSFRSTFS